MEFVRLQQLARPKRVEELAEDAKTFKQFKERMGGQESGEAISAMAFHPKVASCFAYAHGTKISFRG